MKSRTEEIQDIDYLHKLNDKEKAWLNNFMEEYVNANMQHEGKKFHKTKKSRKKVYDKNNARNRDAFTQSKIRNNLNYYDTIHQVDGTENLENRMILEYDLKNNIKSKKEVKEYNTEESIVKKK